MKTVITIETHQEESDLERENRLLRRELLQRIEMGIEDAKIIRKLTGTDEDTDLKSAAA